MKVEVNVKECPICTRRTLSKHLYCPDCGVRYVSADEAINAERLTRIAKNVEEHWTRYPEIMEWDVHGLVRIGETKEEYKARHIDHCAGVRADRRPALGWAEKATDESYPLGGISRDGKYIKWMLELRDDRLKGTVLYDRQKPEAE